MLQPHMPLSGTWNCNMDALHRILKDKMSITGMQTNRRRGECHMIVHESRNESFDDECIQHTMGPHPLKADDRDASWSRCVMLEPFNVMLGTNALNTHTMLDHIVSQYSITFHMMFPCSLHKSHVFLPVSYTHLRAHET